MFDVILSIISKAYSLVGEIVPYGVSFYLSFINLFLLCDIKMDPLCILGCLLSEEYFIHHLYSSVHPNCSRLK